MRDHGMGTMCYCEMHFWVIGEIGAISFTRYLEMVDSVWFDIRRHNWKSTVSGIGKNRKSAPTVTEHHACRLCCLKSACIYSDWL